MGGDHRLTPRQAREQEYYDEYARRYPVTEVTFDPVEGVERRPWNPYWVVYEHAAMRFRGPGSRALDFGCGQGVAAVRLAHLGYEVWGFDVSEANVTAAMALAERHGLAHRCHFSVQVAERLEYEDEMFDFVLGLDILHHVELEPALLECRRVMARGGLGVFREHVEVPALDFIRNLAPMRKLVPKDKSFERHVTEDERKLTPADLDLVSRVFPGARFERFSVLARADRFLRRPDDPRPSRLERLDYFLSGVSPAYGKLGGAVVMLLPKP